jgi:hypothetical protein
MLVYRVNALSRRILENLLQKRQARGALAFEHAAFGPP